MMPTRMASFLYFVAGCHGPLEPRGTLVTSGETETLRSVSLEPPEDLSTEELLELFEASYWRLEYAVIVYDPYPMAQATHDLLGLGDHPAATATFLEYARDRVAWDLSREFWAYYETSGSNASTLHYGVSDLQHRYDESEVRGFIGNSRHLLVLTGEMETLEEQAHASRARIEFVDGAVVGDVEDETLHLDLVDSIRVDALLDAAAVHSYAIEVSDDGTLFARSQGSTDTFATLMPHDYSWVEQDDDGGVAYNFQIRIPVTAGSYRLDVRGYDESSEGPYELVLDLEVAPQ